MQQTDTTEQTIASPMEETTTETTIVEGMEAIEQVNRRIPLPPVPHIALTEMEGKPLFEQFLLVWGTPERGAVLWEMWQSGRDEFSLLMLEQLAKSTAEEAGISVEEAKRRLAVEKVLSDVGPEYAVRFLEGYKNWVFTYSRPLKPMVVRPKKRR